VKVKLIDVGPCNASVAVDLGEDRIDNPGRTGRPGQTRRTEQALRTGRTRKTAPPRSRRGG
jgi:hypothetical protein